MMGTFSSMTGQLQNTAGVTAGLAEALITTCLLYTSITDNAGLDTNSDKAADKNKVREVLNAMAGKLQ